MKKICGHCRKEKDISEFWKKKTNKDGYQHSCKSCINELNTNWKLENEERHKATVRKSNIKRKEKKAEWYKKNKIHIYEKIKEKKLLEKSTKIIKEKQPPKGKCPIRRKIACERYYQKHKSVIANRIREWRLKNKNKSMATVARRRSQKKKALVAYRNDFIINEIYDLADIRTKITGIKWEVDHIVPLQSDIVCGLHWEYNLQVITKSQNVKKGNRYWPDMP